MDNREMAVKILQEASILFEEGEWAKYRMAYTRDGNPVGFDDPDAYAFCLTGGINRAAYDLGDRELTSEAIDMVFHELLGFLRAECYEVELTVKGLTFYTAENVLMSWNDNIAVEEVEVLELLEEVRERLAND